MSSLRVLYLGLVIALVALDKLFGAHVTGRSCTRRLYLVIALVINTWIFLAEVPRGLAGAGGRYQLSPSAQGLRPIHSDPAGLHLSPACCWRIWSRSSPEENGPRAGSAGWSPAWPLPDCSASCWCTPSRRSRRSLDPDLHPLALRRADTRGRRVAGGVLESACFPTD